MSYDVKISLENTSYTDDIVSDNSELVFSTEPFNNAIIIDGVSVSLNDVVQVAKQNKRVELSENSLMSLNASRSFVESIIQSTNTVYGINTGFGRLANVKISQDELRNLQVNLVRSHMCGLGKPFSEAESRAITLLRANVLAKGVSGVRPIVIETLLQMLNRGVHPVIPEKGSVGASGDLAPLAHMAAVAIGEGEAFYNGERMPGGKAMSLAEITPLRLEAKEGLSLINGTQALTAIGALALDELFFLCDLADVTGSLTLEALCGRIEAFNPLIHKVRSYTGQSYVASRILELIEGSEMLASPKAKERVQDAYSLRCIPQVHGAVRDALAHAFKLVEIEINSGIDNPLVFAEEGEILSGGNFHGIPLAMAFDYAAIAASELGSIAERRIERLVNPDLSGLPAFLTKDPGTCSGLMIAHVTAVALCGENKILAHPASIDSLPTSANTEDHVSMGMTSAVKLRTIVDNVASILAIELLASTQALEFSRPLQPGYKLREVYSRVRDLIPAIETDIPLTPLMERLKNNLQEILV